ncbi:hypothetical protein JOF48_002522 [Arthrobacter stackebrandtii]|uniref:DUF4233 domain-containing protein n=1 Tax=Arthrobacter stackebrandtii TaxID=272161 RepID=A0ABS4YY78_9MICC|nr:hypothetical protein [Arthrobacter stackebrandtii]MBP2413723.1 hypothetical protein [Arthrobacter stackebrandtii]PYH00018.1 hypothetical protein CVV67_12650 [Arthrobacter stackebrandtii]
MQKEPRNPSDVPADDASALPGAAVPDAVPGRPAGVFVVSAVVGLEALALIGLGIYAIYAALTQPMFSLASAVFLIVLLLGLGAGLAAVAVNAFKGMRWTRSAAFVWQLLMVAMAVPSLLEGNVLLGLALLLPPLAAAYYLFTPKVVAFSQRTTAEGSVH